MNQDDYTPTVVLLNRKMQKLTRNSTIVMAEVWKPASLLALFYSLTLIPTSSPPTVTTNTPLLLPYPIQLAITLAS